ncbi:hypothetical protein MSG28_009171, partial [Choristoneura fumiferana]
MGDVVPILYGGANYSRFLPPGSYLDARKYKPEELASLMAHLIKTPVAYRDFFRWKNHYSYHRPKNICGLCAALNNQTMLEARMPPPQKLLRDIANGITIGWNYAELEHFKYKNIVTINKYNMIDQTHKRGMSRIQKFLLLFVSFTFIWMAEYITRNPKADLDYPFDELTINDTITRKKETTKYLLLWTPSDYAPLSFLGEGNEAFIRNKCPFLNCFVTSRRDFFGGNLTKFDAIAFNGRNIGQFQSSDLPNVRYPHQKYIFFNMESSSNNPICNPLFENFFNLTATYKLNSDIVFAYLLIKNTAGEEVGPRIDMTWEKLNDDPVTVNNKSETVVWMASNCHTKSKREKYVQKLDVALNSLGYNVDIYGRCGKLKCPRSDTLCDNLPSKYYFYLSFENSIAEDYVTEKVYRAIKNAAVPVVFGGANYSRFLPPGSYLDAKKHSPKKLATLMARLIKNSSAYSNFFKWRNHYTYHEPYEAEDVCRVCTALNDKTMMETHKVINNINHIAGSTSAPQSIYFKRQTIEYVEEKSTMTRYTPLNSPQMPIRNSGRSTFIFVLFCFAFPVSIIYVNSIQYSSAENNEKLMQDALDIVAQDPRFAEKYREKDTFSNELKYILLWTPQDASPFYYLGNGQQGFIKNKCEFTNCFVTPKRDYLGGDITKFDAVAINGRAMRYTTLADLPQQRSPYQKFIFFNLESSTYQPVCNPWFDGYFNWTATYKLNSDIVYSYIYIRNSEGEPVGPRIDMEWITDMKEVDDDFKKKLQTKKKAAAWFVSHCKTRSKRENYVKYLLKALASYGLTVDIYGGCGAFRCSRAQEKYCNTKVETDYYFYLSFENAFAEDYVTEKLLTALNHNAVPIVYGGSNYSSDYYEYFRWRNHYSYSESEPIEDVCNVCAALNDKEKVLTQSVYEHFRS